MITIPLKDARSLGMQGAQQLIYLWVPRRLPRLAAVLPIAIAALLQVPPLAKSHPGGLNSEGCHNNRRTGEYHCHRKKAGAPGEGSSQLMPAVGSSNGSTNAPFANCAAARAAGAAPVRAGDPGYSARLDRDGDGVGCE